MVGVICRIRKCRVVILFLCHVVRAQLNFGFDQVDYSGIEESGVINVVVIKENENVGDFVLTLTPLSFAQFAAIGPPLPDELQGRVIDPAEGEV